MPVPAKGWGDMTLRDWREMFTSAGRGIAAGPPIVGPAVDKALDAVVAAPGAVVGYKPLPEGYAATRADMDRMQRQNPKAYAAGNVAGSITSTLPLMRAVPRAFGGDSFIGQSLTGAGTAGADAAVRNWTLDPKTVGTAALVGSAAPAIGSVLAPVGQLAAQGGSAGLKWLENRLPASALPIRSRPAAPLGTGAADAAEQGYNSLSQGGVGYSPAHVQDLIDLTKRDFYTGSVSTTHTAPRTHTRLDDIMRLPPNPKTLHEARKSFQRIANENGGMATEEGKSALLAKDRIEQFLDQPPPSAVVSGNIPAASVMPRIREANANYRGAKVDEEIQGAVNTGQVNASTQAAPYLAEGGFVRNAIKGLRKDEKAANFRQPNEEAALANVNRPGSIGEGFLRGVSDATGGGRVNPLSLIAALATGGGGFAASGGGVWPTIASLVGGASAGAASSAATTALTRNAVQRARETAIGNTPYGRAAIAAQVNPTLPGTGWGGNVANATDPVMYRSEIARLLGLQAARQDPNIFGGN